MTCSRCGKGLKPEEPRCAACGAPNSEYSGLFQTSTVLISTDQSDLVYRSVDEVPAPLRTKLLKFTNSSNAATILIADQRGRREIAKAMRNLPAPAQRRLRNTILGGRVPAGNPLHLRKKRIVLAVLMTLVLFAIALAFGHRW